MAIQKSMTTLWVNIFLLATITLAGTATAETVTYTYDNLNRLVSAKYDNG